MGTNIEKGTRVILMNDGGFNAPPYYKGALGTVVEDYKNVKYDDVVLVNVDGATNESLAFFWDTEVRLPYDNEIEEEVPQPPTGNRQSILDEASKLIHGDRAADYGDAKKMHQKVGDLWAAYLGLEGGIQPDQVAMMMALMKIARSTSSPKFDTYVDLAGYAALGGEMAIQE